jgi:DNA-binding response OmpR family regulator
MRLLIVEDEQDQAENLRRLLEHAGYSVDSLGEANEARQHILTHRNDYSLILLDLSLDGDDGLDLLKTIRTHAMALPIIILTGQTEPSRETELRTQGADEYLLKPYSAADLLERISELTSSRVQ